MNGMRWIRTASAITALTWAGFSLAGCDGGEEGQRTGSFTREDAERARASLPAEISAALDSGNAAYRRDDFEAARRHYRDVVRLDSTVASGWFGIYMAEKALGDEAAAADALRRAGGLSGNAPAMHPAPTGDDQPEPETSGGGGG